MANFLSRAVFDYRRGLMTALMDRERWDAIAFTTPDFFQFGTNFHTDVQTWERPILLVVPRDGAPFAVMHELSTNHIRFAREAGRLWVEDITLYAEHPRIGALSKHPYPGPKTFSGTNQPGGTAINALLGQENRTNFQPSYTSAFIDYPTTALQTETPARNGAIASVAWTLIASPLALPGAPSLMLYAVE